MPIRPPLPPPARGPIRACPSRSRLVRARTRDVASTQSPSGPTPLPRPARFWNRGAPGRLLREFRRFQRERVPLGGTSTRHLFQLHSHRNVGGRVNDPYLRIADV